jgi:hypothetical protein
MYKCRWGVPFTSPYPLQPMGPKRDAARFGLIGLGSYNLYYSLLTRSGARSARPRPTFSRSLPEVLRLRFDLEKLSVFPWGSMSCTSYRTVNSRSVMRELLGQSLPHTLYWSNHIRHSCCASAGSGRSHIQSFARLDQIRTSKLSHMIVSKIT